jgi:hypothetical protein
LTGCVDILKYPLSDPNNDEIDQSLIGTWSSLSWDGSSTIERFVTFSKPKGTDVPKGVLCIEEKGKISGFLIPAKISDMQYLSIVYFDNNEWKPEMGWRKELIKGYMPFKYKMTSEKLTMYECHRDTHKRIIEEIKKGNIRGTNLSIDTPDDKDPLYSVTEPTEGLRKYVEENEAWIFTEKKELIRK